MLFALHFTPRQAVKRLWRLARQIEESCPGVIVLNLHPENISETRELHKAVVALARRPGWIALGLETYLQWLESMERLQIDRGEKNRWILHSPLPVQGLVIRYFKGPHAWRRKGLPEWSGHIEVHLN